jgi:hypothetical protein
LPIDSQVVNGRIIGPDGTTPSSLEIEDGRIISVDTEADVWRTVDASGYFVLPGAVQPDRPTGDRALALIKQGISTTIVHLSGRLEDLPDQMGQLAHEAVLDYAVCWDLPADVTPDEIMVARQHGVQAFEISGDHAPGTLVSALGNATVRVPANSAHLAEWTSNAPAATRVIATIESASGLRSVEEAKGHAASVFTEVDIERLAAGSDPALWDAVIGGEIDIIRARPTGTFLVQFVYREGVDKRGMPVQRLVDVCASNPATAYGLAPKKGGLKPRSDADFVVFDPDQESEIDGESVHGRVIYSQLRGDILLFNDELHLPPGNGRMLPVGESRG